MEENPTRDSSDASLIDAFRLGGKESAFRLLYDRHTTVAYRAAWRILGSRHDAEDATQEAWVRAFRSLDRWSRHTSFGAWLRSIAVHVAIDHVRKSSRFREIDDGIEAVTDVSDDRIDLATAIASLPSGSRVVLVLHDIEGFSHEEIGRLLGIAAGTSKAQLFKARRAIRGRLGLATARDG